MATSQGALFGRQVEVIIGTVARPGLARYGNAAAPGQPTPPTPLRIAFSVKKGIKSSPNTAQVNLWNMSAKTRGVITPGMVVTVSAGYAGRLRTLFIGVVDKCISKRDGSAIQTTIDSLDGASAITQATLSQSYAEGIPVTQLFHDLAAAMGTRSAANPTGIVGGVVVGVDPMEVFRAPYTCHGMCRDILTDICKQRGLEWSVQNGGLTIVPLQAHTGQTAISLTERSGMTGIPSLNKDLLTVESLLNPAIAPGAVVFVDSRSVRGFFKVRGGTWEGDTHGDKWTCSIEAVNLPDVAEVTPVTQGILEPASPEEAVA